MISHRVSLSRICFYLRREGKRREGKERKGTGMNKQFCSVSISVLGYCNTEEDADIGWLCVRVCVYDHGCSERRVAEG